MLLSSNEVFDYQIPVAKKTELQFTSAMKDDVSDEQLMLLYAKGDAAAFERLYTKHKGGLYRFCLRQLANQAKAEECFQEIWMKLINSRVNYQPKALFTTYLYRIAQNHIIDTVRKDKKLKQETEFDEAADYWSDDDHREDIADNMIQSNQRRELRKQIENLPLEQKTALLLQLDAGLSLEEISNILDCGRETIKSRLRYATTKLKSLLGESL